MAEFKEFVLLLKFETRLKHGWFHLKLCSVFRYSVLNWNRFLWISDAV